MILVAGLLLRVVVYLALDPSNNDPHIVIISYILEHGVPPGSDQHPLGYHPPLYYILASPFAVGALATSSDPVIQGKIVQLLSLLLSLVNLYAIYRFVAVTRLLGERGRIHAIGFVAAETSAVSRTSCCNLVIRALNARVANTRSASRTA